MPQYNFEITISGLNEVLQALDDFGEDAIQEIDDAMEEVGTAMVNEVRRNIADQGLIDTQAGYFGIWQKHGVNMKSRAHHNPWLLISTSVPTYYMSMYETAKGVFGYGRVTVDMGAGSDYSGIYVSLDMNAAMDEYGTSKRRARPFLRPALDTMASFGYIKIEDAMRRSIVKCNQWNRGVF